MRLIVRPEAEAEADIGDAHAWYESQQSGLGNRLISEMTRSSAFELRRDVHCCVISLIPCSLLRHRMTLR